MIESLVRAALKQRLIVAVIAAVLFFFGLNAAQKLSVDGPGGVATFPLSGLRRRPPAAPAA